MMGNQGYLLVAIVLFLSVLKSGQTLKCWKCTSENDASCRDHFNITQIRLNQRRMESYYYGNLQPVRNDPQLVECDEMRTSFGQVKNVCLKWVLTAPHGPNEVHRECRMVLSDFKVGACPDDIIAYRPKTMEFCGTCDKDGCNSATLNGVLFIMFVPTVILLLGK